MQIQRFIRVLAATLLVAMVAVGCVDLRVKVKTPHVEGELTTFNGHWETLEGGAKVCKEDGNECRVKDPTSPN